jgi:peptidoglycan-N-acetylglucosamine deacetylase
MNFIRKKYFYLVIILYAGICNSQTIDSLYEVGTWQGFKQGAVSFTFDDNCPNQLSIVMPMFDQYGFKMTFFTVINWGPNWTALQAAALNGHEIASHTMSHTSLNSLTDEQQTAELKNSQDAINSHIQGQKCLTIAYPNCILGNSSICSQYYIAARGCSGVVEPKTPSNFMNISSIVCGNQGSIQKIGDFTNKINAAVSSKGWVVFLIHAIDNEPGYSSTSSTELKGALDYINLNKSKVWESTFGNIARYIKERNNISVKEVSVEDTIITVNVTDTLNDSTYNYPVTVRRRLPQNWTSAAVSENGKDLNSEVVYEDSLKYIIFDVIPDSGEISIKRISGIVPVQLDSFSAIALSNSIELSWTTATELDNNGFTVERSMDKIQWEQIAYIKGKGTTTEPSSYSFKDLSKTAGNVYYRLKQINYDGSYTYSKIIETAINIPVSFNLEQNYPNPFNPITTINYQIPEDSFVTLKVYDLLGREVYTIVNKQLTPGKYSVQFDGSNLPSGFYLYQLKAAQYTSTRKIVLLK